MTRDDRQPTLGAHARATRGLDWIVPDWPAPAERAARSSTTRAGGVSTGPYATMNLGAQRPRRPARRSPRTGAASRRSCRGAGRGSTRCTAPRVATLRRRGARQRRPSPTPRSRASRGVVCAVLTADCLPVLFADRAGTAVGIAHAGWRGLAAGVLEATVAALARSARPRELVAWLGPAIGPAAFEVGADVRAAFCERRPGRAPRASRRTAPGKWHADLYGLARRRLARAGVTRVHGGGLCTYTDDARFFSYRRERESGRMATAGLARALTVRCDAVRIMTFVGRGNAAALLHPLS